MKTNFELTEQNYRYLFENASDAMWLHDLGGNILLANKACEDLTGYTLKELSHMNVAQFLTGEHLDAARGVKRKLLKGETIEQPYEQRLVRKNKSIGLVKMSSNLVKLDGKPIGFENIARDVTEEKQMQDNLRYYVQQITRVQEDERKRIARQLHDEMSPHLLLLIQRLDSIEVGHRSAKSFKEHLEDLRAQAVEALEGLRRCAQDLRPRILDDLGLIAAIEWMADDLTKKNGTDARVKVTGNAQKLPVEVELLLFRIAQEALSNVRRHSGASEVDVELTFEDDKLRLTVTDNGKGFVLPTHIGDLAGTGKLGLVGMQERCRLLGGLLDVRSESGKGTQVAVEMPLPG